MMNSRLKYLGSLTCAGMIAAGCGGSQKPGSNETGEPPVDIFEPDTQAKTGLWSDAAIWPNGELPGAGDSVLIPKGTVVILDSSTPALGDVLIEGELKFEDKDRLELTAKNIMVHGKLEIGTKDAPFEGDAVITLTDTDTNGNLMGMGARGLLVMGGELELHGQPPQVPWSQLGASAEAGSNELTLKEEVADWEAGSKVVVAPTDFENGRTEAFDLSAVEGAKITISGSLEKSRWGVLQYVHDDGLSLESADVPENRIIDERAEVANLSRKIVIQGPDDDLWNDRGFGAHIMLMEGASTHIDGIEVRRMGQAGNLGRYPIHLHRLSYDSDGKELGDLDGQYIRNSSVWDSSQRCFVIHATNGITLENNICYDIKGHAFFFEDAVERRNVLRNNLALFMNAPDEENLLLINEEVPAGYWITNPDNTIETNSAADSIGTGFWLAFPEKPLGSSKAVDIYPIHTMVGSISDLTTHSNRQFGFMFDNGPRDDTGATESRRYNPKTNGKPDGESLPFSVQGWRSYKQSDGPSSGTFWNNSKDGTYKDFVFSDLTGLAFKGASLDCTIQNNVAVATTFNEGNSENDWPAVGVATYHSQCDIKDNTFVNFPYVPDSPTGISGAFSTADYYTRPLDKGLVRNTGNILINSHPGARKPSPNISGQDNYSLSGALWDAHGFWGEAGRYWVYDLPYLTDGTTCEPVTPAGDGMSCVGPYYGMFKPIFDGETDDFVTLEYKRVDNDTAWSINNGNDAKSLGHMRHGAAVRAGEYVVVAPDKSPQTTLLEVTNLLEAEDFFLLALPYAGDSPPKLVYSTTWPGGGVDHLESYRAWKAGDDDWKSKTGGDVWGPLVSAGSRAEVEASSGELYWFDADANLVWLRPTGARLAQESANAEEFSNSKLYGSLHFMVSAEIP